MRPQNRKIHRKGRPVQQTKNYNCVYLSNQHTELEQRRPAHAKPDFTWLSGPRNGTWKRTCGISCLRSLAPMRRFAMQHHPGNIHQSFATPRHSSLLRYSVLCFNSITQCNWHFFFCPSPVPFGGSTVLETYSSTTSRSRPRTRGESIRG